MIRTYRKLWKEGGRPDIQQTDGYSGWPNKGLAIVGDFSGIQNFVYRPAPGAGGAGRRLRSRSFRVSAYTELVARWCLRQLSSSNPRLLYTAGGRFIIASEPFDSWENKLARMQAEIDGWAWANFEGELLFHLAAVPFDSAKVPNESLNSALELRRRKPLSGTLQSTGRWQEFEFLRPSAAGEARCDSCGVTQQIEIRPDGATVCRMCVADEAVGSRLPQSRFAKVITNSGDALISALNLAMELDAEDTHSRDEIVLSLGTYDREAEPWFLLKHVPMDDTARTLDFDEIAARAPGRRKWLGCLRIDADQVGRHFAHLGGDPARIWGLSRLLNHLFASTAEELLEEEFPNIYAVYGGGDDLFVVGPWTDTLDFAVALQKHFRAHLGDDLTFSAGLALVKPREHVLSMARKAAEELDKAKQAASYGRVTGRNQINALGTTCDWEMFVTLLSQAKQVASWLNSGHIPARFLHQLLELHTAWFTAGQKRPTSDTAASVKYRPLLYYQICRNLKKGPVSEWAHSLLHSPSAWPWVVFIARYAMLATRRDLDQEG